MIDNKIKKMIADYRPGVIALLGVRRETISKRLKLGGFKPDEAKTLRDFFNAIRALLYYSKKRSDYFENGFSINDFTGKNHGVTNENGEVI